MSSSKQRNNNRANANSLRQLARNIELQKHTCENCGEPGGHWVSIRGMSIEAILSGVDDQEGFWTCSKYYDPVTKKRITP